MPNLPDRVCVGVLAGAFGVNGEVRLKSFCAQPEAIAAYAPLFTEDGSRSFTLRLTRTTPGGFGARLSGVTTKEQADALKGTSLFADRDRLPNLPDDEYYHADLIGLAARSESGAALGTTVAIENYGASDVVEIERPDGRRFLVPLTPQAVPHWDEVELVVADAFVD